jgi:hypothetical protein
MALTQAGIDGEIDLQLPSGADITASALRLVLHDMNAGIFQTGITGFATPSTAVGLTASAGTAATAMRSDGAPALDQTIAPTWTAAHVFSNATVSSNTSTGAVTVAGGVGIAGALNVGTTINTGGNIYISAAPLQAAKRLTGTVSASGSTDLSLSLATGVTVLGVTVYTTLAFTGSGTVTLSGGSATGDTAYFSAQDIKALGVHVMTLSGAGQGNMPVGNPNYFMRINQSGTPSSTGSASIVVDYLVSGP